MSFVGTILRTVTQFQVRNKSIEDLIASAEAAGKTIIARTADKPDTPPNRQVLRHIIGIERWGQRRLKTLVGEPPIQDEYDGYQPADTLDFNALRTTFEQTRAETIAVVREIQKRGITTKTTARHNDMGDLPVANWLRYLTMHANFETRQFK